MSHKENLGKRNTDSSRGAALGSAEKVLQIQENPGEHVRTQEIMREPRRTCENPGEHVRNHSDVLIGGLNLSEIQFHRGVIFPGSDPRLAQSGRL